jgi:ribosomal protein L37E
VSSDFDRVRPRAPRPVGPSAPAGHDAQGKRALFSDASDPVAPTIGSARIECSRCGERTVLGLGAAVRTAVPSLHLGLRVGRGDDVRSVALGGREFPTYLRCPACGRPSWVKFTLQL